MPFRVGVRVCHTTRLDVGHTGGGEGGSGQLGCVYAALEEVASWSVCMPLMVGARVYCATWLGTWGRLVGCVGVDPDGLSDGPTANHP
jgi:hypothetical protein